MPSDSFSHTALALAPADDIWKDLDLPETWEGIGVVDRIFDPRFEGLRLIGFSFETEAAGKTYVGEATPAERREGSAIGWKIKNSELTGTVEVKLTPAGENTEITVNLDVESVGLLSTMFFPVVAGAIGSGLPAAVESFAAGFGN